MVLLSCFAGLFVLTCLFAFCFGLLVLFTCLFRCFGFGGMLFVLFLLWVLTLLRFGMFCFALVWVGLYVAYVE